MKNDDKSTNAAAILSVVYILGIVAIAELMDMRPQAFWLCVIWTLAVIIYVLVHDYVENIRESVHKRIKAVFKAEMRFHTEREAFYAELERMKRNDV